MNNDFQRRDLTNRLSTEDQETLESMYTDYCRGEKANQGATKDVLDEIEYYGEIGGHKL
jgi:hypothetical protein